MERLNKREILNSVDVWFSETLDQSSWDYENELMEIEDYADEIGDIILPAPTEVERLKYVVKEEKIDLSDEEIETGKIISPKNEKNPVGRKIFKYMIEETSQCFVDGISKKTVETEIVISKHILNFSKAFREVDTCYSPYGCNCFNFIAHLLIPEYRIVMGLCEGKTVSRLLLYVNDNEKTFSMGQQYGKGNYSLYAAVFNYYDALGYEEIATTMISDDSLYSERSFSGEAGYARVKEIYASSYGAFDNVPRCDGCGAFLVRGGECPNCSGECSNCGCFLGRDDEYVVDPCGDLYCVDCAGYCSECGKFVERESMEYGRCWECLDYCEHCGEVLDPDEEPDVIVDACENEIIVCPHCYSNQ